MGREWYLARGEEEGPGCMGGMLHCLDFHQLLFTASGSESPQAPPRIVARCSSTPQLKGVEAPRNSLELDDRSTASTAAAGEELYIDIPLGIQLSPASGTQKKMLVAMEEEEQKRSLQAVTPRTPNLVARLMGLELLPDLASTPSTPQSRSSMVKAQKRSSKKEKEGSKSPPRQPLQTRNCDMRTEGGSRSMPNTPRPSSARRSWDTDPRLSLQLNNENNNINADGLEVRPDLSCLCQVSNDRSPTPASNSRRKSSNSSRHYQDENKSPRSHYARDIVKQLKESITRRKGRGNCNDEHAARSSSTTASTGLPELETKIHEIKQYPSDLKPLPTSCISHPEIRFLKQPNIGRSRRPSEDVTKIISPAQSEQKPVKMPKSPNKKPSFERYTESIKKKPSPSSTVAIPQKQRPISISDKKSHTPVQINVVSNPNSEQCRQPKDGHPEFRYMTFVLEQASLSISADNWIAWCSPTVPVDPIIFHRLELQLSTELELGPMQHRWNRKLMFHLVNEILSDIGSWRGSGEALMLTVWSKIRNFPSADCRVVGDIDMLVERDLPVDKVRGLLSHPSVAEEAEEVALEIEHGIFDSLVSEAAASLSLLRSGQWARANHELRSKVVTWPAGTKRCAGICVHIINQTSC